MNPVYCLFRVHLALSFVTIRKTARWSIFIWIPNDVLPCAILFQIHAIVIQSWNRLGSTFFLYIRLYIFFVHVFFFFFFLIVVFCHNHLGVYCLIVFKCVAAIIKDQVIFFYCINYKFKNVLIRISLSM